MTTAFIVISMILTLGSGIPGLFLKGGSLLAQRIATILHLLGCTAGLILTVLAFQGAAELPLIWPLPGGIVTLRVDALSAFFLVPLFLVMGAGSIYGEGYWPESKHPENGRKLRFFYGALTAGFTLVISAGDAWLFLAGWEIVGLSAFFLVTTDDTDREALRAGWIYLIAAHGATLVLFAMFGVYSTAAGTWQLNTQLPADSVYVAPILLLTLVGCGIKAGLMPFHVWLPEAHAAAPSHISAILSGIVLKMGVYGLVRMMTLVPVDVWFGRTLLFAGILSGVLGVVFALAQHDLKRLLAYHSIENIGIIFIGLGAGILGRSETWGSLATAGAMLHVWNHGFFKALLFFAAGSVVHNTGTRTIDKLGGLLRKLPATGISFLIGAVAICGLPPLNGFVSEWLIYVASFQNVISGPANGGAILAAPALALIGALAVACFVKAFSAVFLGHPRSQHAEQADHEPASMRVSMGVLAATCILIGFWPLAALEPLAQVAAFFNPTDARNEISSLFSSLPAATFLGTAIIAISAIVVLLKSKNVRKAGTWDCGYSTPTKRMQYTASSFAAPLINLFQWTLRPDHHHANDRSLFPEIGFFESHVPDPVLDRFLIPAASVTRRVLVFVRFIQAGRIQVYIFYVVATLLILLAWSAL